MKFESWSHDFGNRSFTDLRNDTGQLRPNFAWIWAARFIYILTAPLLFCFIISVTLFGNFPEWNLRTGSLLRIKHSRILSLWYIHFIMTHVIHWLARDFMRAVLIGARIFDISRNWVFHPFHVASAWDLVKTFCGDIIDKTVFLKILKISVSYNIMGVLGKY